MNREKVSAEHEIIWTMVDTPGVGGPEEGDWMIPQTGSKNHHACFESTKRERTVTDWGTGEGEPISRGDAGNGLDNTRIT